VEDFDHEHPHCPMVGRRAVLGRPHRPRLDTAIAFYGAVLTWEFQDAGDEYGGYRGGIAEVGGGAAAGIGRSRSDSVLRE